MFPNRDDEMNDGNDETMVDTNLSMDMEFEDPDPASPREARIVH